ncbi:MAG: preprotein translocase subunit SecE [Saccharofermentanales bacterium]|jgi:preprotein translocase subunit SecE|nr:preprotein translocase subunit SecE [Clostridiaceae bacterium]
MMADKGKKPKQKMATTNRNTGAVGKTVSFFARTGKRLKNFFVSLKAELKRVIWPDRKRLIQSTATVLAICVIVGIILFIVDSLIGGLLNLVGFYDGSSRSPTAAPTPSETSTIAETTAGPSAEASETTSAG